MLTWVSGRGRILIVVHDNPDPDSLASAMALRHLFAVRLNREAVIAFSGMIGRSENLAMAKLLQIPLTPFPLIELKMFQVVCLLDSQPETGNNCLPARASTSSSTIILCARRARPAGGSTSVPSTGRPPPSCTST
jgi:nanoRNase/pAp phosphatase (c-di-AMP/oligoRNAs hydrolase)